VLTDALMTKDSIMEGEKGRKLTVLREFSIDLEGEPIEEQAVLCRFKSLKMGKID
jgi:hypothetical protein